jgi:hypothetical protein
MSTFKSAPFLVFLLATAACGGRVPSPKTAQSVSRGYFRHYGNKYESSVFGRKNVADVAINSVEEISHNAAYTDTVVMLRDGGAAHALVKMEKHFPRGWKVVSWELLETAGR